MHDINNFVQMETIQINFLEINVLLILLLVYMSPTVGELITWFHVTTLK